MKRVVWPTDIAGALADVAEAASADTGKAITAADAQRLLFDTNPSTADRLGWTAERREKPLRSARDRVRNSGYNPMAAEPLVHYAWLRTALEGVVTEGLGKAGRTAVVRIRKGPETQDLKWKKAEALVRDEGWEVVEVLSE
jgi:hypothetical protein